MVKVHYVEYDATHKDSFVFDIPEGQDSYLLLLVHTAAVFLVNDELVQSPPNSIVLYKPHQRIYYRACEKAYGNDWIRFEADEEYVTETIIPGGMPFTIRDTGSLHKLFQLMTTEHKSDNEMKDIVLDKLLQIVFHKLSEVFSSKSANQLCKNLNDLRNQVYKHADAKWTVGIMADKLNISVGHLEKIYKQTFGVSCMEDVINSRITLAKKYLKTADYSIAEIAHMCGYKSAEHFYRQFKKAVGMTPKNYQARINANL